MIPNERRILSVYCEILNHYYYNIRLMSAKEAIKALEELKEITKMAKKALEFEGIIAADKSGIFGD